MASIEIVYCYPTARKQGKEWIPYSRMVGTLDNGAKAISDGSQMLRIESQGKVKFIDPATGRESQLTKKGDALYDKGHKIWRRPTGDRRRLL